MSISNTATKFHPQNAQACLTFGSTDHANRLHGKHKSGAVVAQNDVYWHERCGLAQEQLLELVGMLTGFDDAYMSVNAVAPFKRRGYQNISHLTCNFIDADFYHTGLTREQAITKALKICQDNSLPDPSLLFDSGRGMYLLWVYTKPVYCGAKSKNSDKDKARWTTTQELLIQLFELVGADPKCKDAARVLRLAGTINSKSERPVTAYEVGGSVNPATLRNSLIRAVETAIPTATPPAKKPKPAQNPVAKPVTPYRIGYYTNKQQITAMMTRRSLVYARMEDLRTLARLRGGKLTDHREMSIFYFAISAAVFCNTRESLLREVSLYMFEFIQCGGKYDYHRPEKLLATVLRRHKETQQARIDGDVVTDLNYKAKNVTIIRNLEITCAEQTHFKTIICKDEKNARKNARRTNKRRAQGMDTMEEYNQKRAASKDEKAQSAREMRAGGLSIRAIADAMGISKSQVQRYLAG